MRTAKPYQAQSSLLTETGGELGSRLAGERIGFRRDDGVDPPLEANWSVASKSLAMTGWRIGFALGPADLITGRLDQMPYLRYIPPQGAFYIFADIRETFGKGIGNFQITDDISFCEALLEHAEVATIPGSSFLQPGFFRMSFATSEEIINTAMDRMHAFLGALK